MAITHGNVAQLIGSVDAGLAGPAGVVAVAFVGLRRLGLGDLRRAVAWGRLVVVPEPVVALRLSCTICWLLSGLMCCVRPRRRRMLSPQGLESVALVVAGEACPVSWCSVGAGAGDDQRLRPTKPQCMPQ
ncbi:linear gramicidin synthetase subunit D domain protein [Mycobacterium xenopi 4042]|uniref:Linear gramicidin synthetase subunit D domain protein n=1 Tax=Mycobacterium xenopi 4042 TaxID=1299334 RepID=X8CLA8_MYCXE|nr:linear gramicidin synthetase subunit D domain protein [Mycobacterium xenopi 4042]